MVTRYSDPEYRIGFQVVFSPQIKQKRKEILIGEAFVADNYIIKLLDCKKLTYEDAPTAKL